MKCGMLVKAGEEAFKVKDIKGLESLRGKASGSTSHEIDRMIARLRPTK